MEPKLGDYIRVFMKFSCQTEGYVVSWQNNKAVLKSKNNEMTSIINNISDDVILIKVFHTIDKPIAQPTDKPAQEQPIRNDENKYLANFLKKVQDISSTQQSNYGLPPLFLKK